MDNVVEALIEIPLHSKNKYEVDNATGKIKLDRVIYASMVYPTEYGIIENTLAPDGDPLDILVVSDYPSFPGCYVPARVLGYLEMTDGGKPDYKLKEIRNFFENYKVLQGVNVTTGAYRGKEDAIKIIEECTERYKQAVEG